MLWIRFGMDLHSRLIFFIVSWNFLLALFQHSSASSVGPVGAKPNFGPVGGRSYGQQQQHHPSHSESAPLSAPNTPYLSQAASLTYQTAAHNYLYGGEASLGGVESPYGPCWGETVPPGGSSWPQGLSWKDKLLLGPLLGSCFCGLSLCQLYCIYGPKSTYRYYVCSSIRILPDLMQELPSWQRVGDCQKWKRRNIIIVFKKSKDRNYRFLSNSSVSYGDLEECPTPYSRNVFFIVAFFSWSWSDLQFLKKTRSCPYFVFSRSESVESSALTLD